MSVWAPLAAALALAAQAPNPRIKFPELRQTQRYQVKGHIKQIPEGVRRLEDQWVTVNGFVYLRFDGEEIREVLICETMFGRGIGAQPSPFNSVAVRFRGEKPPDGLTSGQTMTVSGIFRIRKEGRLEEGGERLTGLFHVVEALEGDVPNPDRPPNPPEAGVSAVTFGQLEAVKGGLDRGELNIPSEIARLDGNWITLTGNVLIPWAEREVSSFLLAKNPWDGCCLGEPPMWYNSVVVKLREGTVLRDRYAPVQTVSGRLRVSPEKKKDYIASLYVLDAAVEGAIPSPKGGAASAGTGWLVGGGVAAAAALVVLAVLVPRLRRRAPPVSGSRS